ncbi:loader of gp41 DNA helicase [Synechococcus phage S-CRM01]|uniref:DNA helicase loader n=1 Tax=Synechococcus phage S-CRM01 TaxID=1026955 RepID=UPI000209E386|nr:DNA helicase loader [Synechococcus phage S-CRM01]AEC53020.1 loader of gp41 DNA helicase [Synechococcus phage S-CRM01]
MKVEHGFQVYKKYLAMKQHFSNEKFDYFQYDGKVNAKETTYQDRSDFWFFETLARKHTPKETEEFMLATFANAEDPSKVWIGEIQRNGKANWLVWQKRQQSLQYTISQDLDRLVDYLATSGNSFNHLFKTVGGHPALLKFYIKRQICVETLIVLDMILGFMVSWDRDLKDALWKSVSFKIRKYRPFLSINKEPYKKLLQKKFL